MMKTKKIVIPIVCFIGLMVASVHAQAQSAQKAPVHPPSVPGPTLAEVPYGEHERQVLDFWKAPSDTPTPVVFAIHGGGWVNGSKERFSKFPIVSGRETS